MKSLLFFFVFFASVNSVFAYETAHIKSIDDLDLPQNYVEVSEQALPHDYYLELLDSISDFRLTVLSESKARSLFSKLETNPKARMKRPGGACSVRRAYIQSYLRKMSIISGRLFLQCPSNRGSLRLRDQSTGHYYTYSNFHDTNIIAVQTSSGNDFRVMDLQFEDEPVTLQEYLTEVENSQRIRPRYNDHSKSGTCYWSISTSYLSM